MQLDAFVNDGWRDHGDDAEGVWARMPAGLELVAAPTDLAKLANLIVHVAGEHLGLWDDGLALIARLRAHPLFDAALPEGKAVIRCSAVLEHAAGRHEEAARQLLLVRGTAFSEASDRIRMLAVSSAALLGRKRLPEATAAFEEAIALASYGPAKDDPAARAMAVTSNNMACELENLPQRTPEERALMLLASEAGLRFWSIAGGWMETERAHYRLSQSCLKAGLPARALEHAQRCLDIVRDNGSDPGEAFFAFEALSLARSAGGDAAGARAAADEAAAVLPSIADESFRTFAAGELDKLRAAVASP